MHVIRNNWIRPTLIINSMIDWSSSEKTNLDTFGKNKPFNAEVSVKSIPSMVSPNENIVIWHELEKIPNMEGTRFRRNRIAKPTRKVQPEKVKIALTSNLSRNLRLGVSPVCLRQ